MGRLLDGAWVPDDATAASDDGKFRRAESVRRDWIRADGSTPYGPEPGRYHLWLAWNCTWSQRTMIAAKLLGLQRNPVGLSGTTAATADAISWSMAHHHRNDGGWWFREGIDALQPDTPQALEHWDREHGFQPAEPETGLSLWKVYVAGDPRYTGRATVPCLWDRRTSTVVSNESSDILRMITTEWGDRRLVPPDLEATIDATNAWVYDGINNGVYKVGFARTQAAYEAAISALFEALDRADEILSRQRFLCGDVLTEADVRLFPTLIRFDAVYHAHFKCSLRRIVDYPNLWPYLRDLYQRPAFRDTVRLDIYKLGYMGRSERLNPSRIISAGPAFDLEAPHGRGME